MLWVFRWWESFELHLISHKVEGCRESSKCISQNRNLSQVGIEHVHVVYKYIMHFQSFSSYMTRYHIYILYLVSNHHLRRISRISRFPSLGCFAQWPCKALHSSRDKVSLKWWLGKKIHSEPQFFLRRMEPKNGFKDDMGEELGEVRSWKVTWMEPLKRKNLERCCFCFILSVVFQLPCSFWRVYWSVMGAAFLVGVWCTS